ncbi:MAG: carboxylesterase family protein, partial [Bacteroidales bacterium]|nr:carboxylesterase family protein [Bacteroidales bacterium]
PLAKGLFHGAISQSGGSFGPTRPTTFPGENMKTLQQAEADGVAFASGLDASSIQELRNLEAEKLIPQGWTMPGGWPIVDGYVIPDDQFELYEAGNYNDVPVLIGYNSDEGLSFPFGRSPEEYIAGVKQRFGPFADDLLAAYPVREENITRSARNLMRDAAFGWHTWSWARLQAETGQSDVYFYYFDQHPERPEDSPQFDHGTPHGMDVPFVFMHLDPSNPNTTQSDLEVSELMGNYWTNFAKYGDPNGEGLPEWTPFAENNPKRLASCQENANKSPVGRVVEDGGTGTYSALMYTDSTFKTHTIFRPADLSVFGKDHKLPIIAWGNGACANSPWEHVHFLSEVASHGFLMIAIGPMPVEGEKGVGKSTSSQMVDAIDWAIAQNSNKSSAYFNKLDVSKIAVSGMSCGGLQTLEVAPDPRVTTVIVCNSGVLGDPGSGMPGMPKITKDQLEKLHTPTLYLLGGESDIAYNNGMDDYNRINHVPVFVANMDVGHGGTYSQPHGGEFATVATAWYKWQLKGDEDAGKLFTGNPPKLSQSTVWTVDKKNLP